MTPPAAGAARSQALDRKEVVASARSIILVGNPNVGKSVLFGALTGKYVTVSNYPGATVEVTRGSAVLGGRHWHVMDTPGTNNLTPMSEDEQVTRDILLQERDYVCLQVCDAKNLRRGLMLAAQLAEAQVPLTSWHRLPHKGTPRPPPQKGDASPRQSRAKRSAARAGTPYFFLTN